MTVLALGPTLLGAEAQGLVGEEGEMTNEERKTEREVRSSLDAILVVEDLKDYLRRRNIGIPSDEVAKLVEHVDMWKGVGLRDGEAWPLVMSVEMWAQGRRMVAQGKRALQIAVGALVISAIVGVGSLLLSIYQTFCLRGV